MAPGVIQPVRFGDRSRSQSDLPPRDGRLSNSNSAAGPATLVSGVRSRLRSPFARRVRSSQNSGHDGSERTAGSRTPKDERSESFGIRTRGRRPRACGLTSFDRSGLRLPGFESRCRCCSLSLADSGHDGIRTHGHRMSSRAANATRIEVRRSIRTELRALETSFRPEPKKTLRRRVVARIGGFPVIGGRTRRK